MVVRRVGRLVVGGLVLLSTATTGMAQQAVGPERTINVQDSEKFQPAVAYNPDRDEYLVVFHHFWSSPPGGAAHRNVQAYVCDRYGKPLFFREYVHPIDTHDRSQAAVAYDPDHQRYFVVYIYDYSGDGSDYDIRGVFLAADTLASVSAELNIATSVLSDFEPKVELSTVSDTFLVAWWRQASSTYTSVRGCPVSSVSFDIGGELLIADHPSENRIEPDLAWDPSRDEIAVAYSNAVDIFVRLVSMPAGLVGEEIAVAAWPDTEAAPAIASCGGADQYLVAWHSSPNMNDLYARFVTGAGVVDGAPLLLADTVFPDEYPEVDCLRWGTDYLVAFQQGLLTEGGTAPTQDVIVIKGIRIDTLKNVAPEFMISSAAADAYRPAVAGAPYGWFTVWERTRDWTGYQDIYGRMAWDLFSDGFEDGLGLWSTTAP